MVPALTNTPYEHLISCFLNIIWRSLWILEVLTFPFWEFLCGDKILSCGQMLLVFLESLNSKEITYVCLFYLSQSAFSPQSAATLSFHYSLAVPMCSRLRWHSHWEVCILFHLKLSQNDIFNAKISIFVFCQEVWMGKLVFL